MTGFLRHRLRTPWGQGTLGDTTPNPETTDVYTPWTIHEIHGTTKLGVFWNSLSPRKRGKPPLLYHGVFPLTRSYLSPFRL